jgi:hypothetical protein
MEKNFTVEQMKAALLTVRDRATEAQMRMLKAHYEHRTLSMDKLAAAGGYGERYMVANSQYGTFCGRIAERLDFIPDGDKVSTIATVLPERNENGRAQWRMDEVAATALEELGWASRIIV